MSEETTGSPKPDHRSVTPLPKVLVQQASEEKNEPANDVPTSNGPEEAQVQGAAPQAETQVAPALQPSPETGESSNPQEQANGAHARPESAESKPDTEKLKVEGPKLEADRLPTKAAVDNDAPATIGTLHDMEAMPEVSVNENEAETQNHDDVLQSPGERLGSKSPRQPNGVSDNDIRAYDHVGEKLDSPIERSRSKTPEAANVSPTPSHEVLSDNKETHEKLASPTKTNPEDGERSLTKTPEGASTVPDKESQPTTAGSVVTEPHSTAQETPENNEPKILGSPTPSVRIEAKGFNDDHPSTGENLTPSSERLEPGELLEMVANGGTGLLTPIESDRKTPTFDRDEDVIPASDRGDEDGHRMTPVQNPEEVESVQTSVGDSQTEIQQGAYENDPDPENSTANKAVSVDSQGVKDMTAHDERSLTSEERADTVSHDAYDASVSGNEEDGPENLKKTSAKEGGTVETPSPGGRRSAKHTHIPDTTKITLRPTSPELQTETATNQLPKEPDGEDNMGPLAFPTVQPSQRSPNLVKLASDSKSSPGSDSDSDVVVTPLGNSSESVHGHIASHHILQDIVENQTVGITLEDLEDVEGLENSHIEEIEKSREAESSSALSILTNDSENDRKTVVEYDTNDLTASSSHDALLDQIKREKAAEMEALKDQIQELRDDINRLHEEKRAEHQKVTDMSLQIKRMTDDNTDNVKTIQNYELKVKKLEDQLEKYKTSVAQQERQVRNGTTTTATPPITTTKKSSVCVIL